MIVAFKIGYQLSEPMQDTCRMQAGDGEEGYSKRLADVNELNTMMFAEDKASCDRDLFEWMCVGGLGYRMAEADTADDGDEGDAPFDIYTLDPRATCVVRSAAYHHLPLMAFWVGDEEGYDSPVYNVFTDERLFKVVDGSVVESRSHTYGAVPIVEYQLNNARMGVFEPGASSARRDEHHRVEPSGRRGAGGAGAHGLQGLRHRRRGLRRDAREGRREDQETSTRRSRRR